MSKENNLVLSIDTGEGFKPVAVLANISDMDAEKYNRVLYRSTLPDIEYLADILNEHFTIESIGGKI